MILFYINVISLLYVNVNNLIEGITVWCGKMIHLRVCGYTLMMTNGEKREAQGTSTETAKNTKRVLFKIVAPYVRILQRETIKEKQS